MILPMLFMTTPDEILIIPDILLEMENSGIDKELLDKISDIAIFDQWAFNLLEMWQNYPDDRYDIICDLQSIAFEKEQWTFNVEYSEDYRIFWSEEDKKYIGVHQNYPSLSYLAPTKLETFVGIIKLVNQIELDIQNEH